MEGLSLTTSIITLNVHGLNTPIKRQTVTVVKKTTKAYYVLSTGHPLKIYISKVKGWKKDIPC